MTIHRIEQGSPEWFALRLGKVTASRVKDVCATIKNGWGAGRRNYAAELVVERLTGETFESYCSIDMKNGSEREPQARMEYELLKRCEVEQVGYADHPTIEMAGGSVDGFVGAYGFIEIKCPKAATHLAYLRGNVVPAEYTHQIDWNFACNPDREWCDFVSYHPAFPPEMQLFVATMLRSTDRIETLEGIVRGFLEEVDEAVNELRARYINGSNTLMDKLRQSAEAS